MVSRTAIIHSFAGGSGKSQLALNLAVQLAQTGQRTLLVDANLAFPSLQALLQLSEGYTLHDCLLGVCEAEHTAHPVTLAGIAPDTLRLVPAGEVSPHWRPERDGTDQRLMQIVQDLQRAYAPDLLLIDTQAGLSEVTLPLIALADVYLLLMRLDRQDYQGTSVMIDVARRLEVGQFALIVTMIPPGYDVGEVAAQVASSCEAPVWAALPYAETLATLASREGGIFVIQEPEHPFSKQVAQLAQQLVARSHAIEKDDVVSHER